MNGAHLSTWGKAFGKALTALQLIDDQCKRSLAEPCACGAPIFVFRGRHCGRWLLRHEPSWRCRFAGTWLDADEKADVLRKWADMSRETLPF